VRGVVEANLHVAGPQTEGPLLLGPRAVPFAGCCCPPQNGADQLPLE
jgi:hypothetical protein